MTSPYPRITPAILEAAYRQGIFPMGRSGSEEVDWYRPDPRTVIDLEDFHVPRRLAKTLRGNPFSFTINRAFREVIQNCSRRSGLPDEVWITDPIVDLYCAMHACGKAHSLEAWQDGELAGGLYGVALGGAFMGESMFHARRDASKACLVRLVEHLRARGFVLLDTQFPTEHLARFGVLSLPHREYLRRLRAALALKSVRFDP